MSSSQTYKMASLFSGIGGLELGIEAAVPGLRTCWQVEQDEFCRRVLAKHWPDAKRYTDVRTVKPEDIRDADVLCGGFPCQDISLAGSGSGLAGDKSALWWEMYRLISVALPRVVVAENVPALTGRGLSDVLCSLARSGYTCEWDTISAAAVGGHHIRRRIFIVAYRNAANPVRKGLQGQREVTERASTKFAHFSSSTWRETAPKLCSTSDGVPRRVARIRALGNAVVPQVAYQVGLKVAQVLNVPV